jgi:hypothetical protein
MTSLAEDIEEFAWRVMHEMSDVSDYIWKSPRMIERETKLEIDKLARYFPNDRSTAQLRWKDESHKLTETFPNLIAVGNLFLSASLFERNILELLKLLERHMPPKEELESTNGIRQHLRALKNFNVDPAVAPYYEEILVAITLRNCLMHAGGLLSASREADKIRGIVARRAFLGREIKQKRKGKTVDDVVIKITNNGERVQISNSYSHISCTYFREYIIGLCKAIVPVPSLDIIDFSPEAIKRPEGLELVDDFELSEGTKPN